MSKLTKKKIILCAIVLLCAVLSLVALQFTLIKCENLVENGFDLIDGVSDLLDVTWSGIWGAVLMQTVFVFMLIVSCINIILVLVSAVDYFDNKYKEWLEKIIILSLTIATIYMIAGIVCVAICSGSYSSYFSFATFSYVPLIIMVILVGLYVYFDKKIKDDACILADANSSVTKFVVEDKAVAPVGIVLSQELEKIELLVKYSELFDKNIITQEEFDAKKSEILGS